MVESIVSRSTSCRKKVSIVGKGIVLDVSSTTDTISSRLYPSCIRIIIFGLGGLRVQMIDMIFIADIHCFAANAGGADTAASAVQGRVVTSMVPIFNKTVFD